MAGKTGYRETDLRVLYDISQRISASLDLKEVLKSIVETIARVIESDSCFIYLYDKEPRELVLMASQNPHPRMMGKIRLKLGEGITGFAAREKKPVVIGKNASLDSRARLFSRLPEDRYEAFLSVPILSKAEIIGVINVQHRKARAYAPQTVKLLSTIAAQVAGAIANAELYESVRKRMKHIETLLLISQSVVSDKYIDEILNMIAHFIADLSGFTTVSIMLLDEKKNELVIKAAQTPAKDYLEKGAVKVESSLSGRAVIEKRPVMIPDVKKEKEYMYPDMARDLGLCSLLSVPMLVKEKVIGVINGYTREEHQFTEEEVKLVQTIAHQAAAAIENTRLLGEVADAREALETRKLIEKAKGILMKDLTLGEESAYKLIHKKSMDTGRSMRSIAEAIILSDTIKASR